MYTMHVYTTIDKFTEQKYTQCVQFYAYIVGKSSNCC